MTDIEVTIKDVPKAPDDAQPQPEDDPVVERPAPETDPEEEPKP